MSAIPSFSVGQSGPLLHFAHANGYPPRAYQPLLDHLQGQYRVHAWEARPLWPGSSPDTLHDWSQIGDDLLLFFEQQGQGEPWIGLGHSFGAHATLMAALAKPDLISRLILIDPPFFLPHQSWGWSLVSRLGLANRLHPLSRRALHRRRSYPDVTTLFASYRSKKVFRGFSDAALQICVDALVVEDTGGGVTLRYSPEWEAQVYSSALRHDRQVWRELHTLKMPLTLIRPEYGATFSDKATLLLRKKLPGAKVITLPKSSHLVPLERPAEIAGIVQGALN